MRISDWSSDVCSSDLLIQDLDPIAIGWPDLLDQKLGRHVVLGLRYVVHPRVVHDAGSEAVPLHPVRVAYLCHGIDALAVAAILQAEVMAHLVRCDLAHQPRFQIEIERELSCIRIDGRRTHEVLGLPVRSEEHTSELQSLMRISYAVFCLKKKKQT